MKILTLGVNGMLGSAVFHTLNQTPNLDVWGTLRHFKPTSILKNAQKIISGIDVLDFDSVCQVLNRVKPDVVINCIGLIKQLHNANNPLVALPINAMFPHRLAGLCQLSGTRLIHISTDCVFSGSKGAYTEKDLSDASDLYGKSKFIGELHDLAHAITLRTSIIGHEISSQTALLEWFLAQEEPVSGYTRAIFSGLPTIELARVIRDSVLPNTDLFGLYHVAAEPISKYDLLHLIKTVYAKNILISADDTVCIDRSLNAQRFKYSTGYTAPPWPELIAIMHQSQNLYQ